MQTLARLMCKFMRVSRYARLARFARFASVQRPYVYINTNAIVAPPIPPRPAVWVMTTRCSSEQNRNCHIYMWMRHQLDEGFQEENVWKWGWGQNKKLKSNGNNSSLLALEQKVFLSIYFIWRNKAMQTYFQKNDIFRQYV